MKAWFKRLWYNRWVVASNCLWVASFIGIMLCGYQYIYGYLHGAPKGHQFLLIVSGVVLLVIELNCSMAHDERQRRRHWKRR